MHPLASSFNLTYSTPTLSFRSTSVLELTALCISVATITFYQRFILDKTVDSLEVFPPPALIPWLSSLPSDNNVTVHLMTHWLWYRTQHLFLNVCDVFFDRYKHSIQLSLGTLVVGIASNWLSFVKITPLFSTLLFCITFSRIILKKRATSPWPCLSPSAASKIPEGFLRIMQYLRLPLSMHHFVCTKSCVILLSVSSSLEISLSNKPKWPSATTYDYFRILLHCADWEHICTLFWLGITFSFNLYAKKFMTERLFVYSHDG